MDAPVGADHWRNNHISSIATTWRNTRTGRLYMHVLSNGDCRASDHWYAWRKCSSPCHILTCEQLFRSHYGSGTFYAYRGSRTQRRTVIYQRSSSDFSESRAAYTRPACSCHGNQSHSSAFSQSHSHPSGPVILYMGSIPIYCCWQSRKLRHRPHRTTGSKRDTHAFNCWNQPYCMLPAVLHRTQNRLPVRRQNCRGTRTRTKKHRTRYMDGAYIS